MDLTQKIDHVEKQILDNGYATADHLEALQNHCNEHATLVDENYYSMILEIFNKAEGKIFNDVMNKKIKDLTAADLDVAMWDLDELYFDLMDRSISKKQAANMKLGTALQKVHG